MSERISRFKKRQEIKRRSESHPLLRGLIDQAAVDDLLHQNIDSEKLRRLEYSTDTQPLSQIDRAEVDKLYSDLKRDFNKNKLDQILEQARRGIISSIITPFGLGKAISVYDQVGGNVTTIHNANRGVYANESDKYNRKEYTDKKNSEGNQFAGAGKNSAGANFTRSKMNENKMVTDAYTGKTVKADTTSPDHIESLSQYHKDGGFMQDSVKKADFATDENNLALTERKINQSMRDFEKAEWAEKKTEGNTENKERFGINDEMLEKEVEKGKATAKKYLPSNLEKGEYYLKNAATTGVNEGLNMGGQQAFGLLLVEFFSSAIEEVKDSFSNGLDGDSLYQDLGRRLHRVGLKVAGQWKNAVHIFSEGFVSGFLSNLVTVIINIFVTTTKRFVRMIREGFFSLLKAIKIVVYPPDNMSYRETVQEAMKLIAAGGVVIAGVALEEVIEKSVLSIPFLVPFASVVTSVVVGSITALSMVLVAYLIDRVDFFGLERADETRYVLDSLDINIAERLIRCEELSEEIDLFL